MPKFETPEPIVASIDMTAGSLWVRATDRTETVVDVRPHNPQKKDDVQAAEQTEVDYADGRLVVRTPRNRLRHTFGGGGPRVDAIVDLPAGSELDGSGWTDYTCDGRLGPVTITGALGDIRIEHAERLRAKSSMGDIIIGRVDGPIDLHTATGEIRIGTAEGTTVAKTSAGNLAIGDAAGDLRLRTAYGDIAVEHAATSVDATTSAGNIRIDEVGGGSVALRTSYGEVEVGVPADVAAWLDMTSLNGNVRSELDAADTPADTDRKVEIRVRNHYGDITVRRA
ncbi:MAG TPA: DUF4097 family beta strand repeat-containing protein [Streptosporangiaceae bacterium]|jgi:hypothetical protein